MPLTEGFTTRTNVQKGAEGNHIHSAKWHRCWTKVQAKGHDRSSAAAICTDSIGYEGSVLKKHRRQRARKAEGFVDVLKGF